MPHTPEHTDEPAGPTISVENLRSLMGDMRTEEPAPEPEPTPGNLPTSTDDLLQSLGLPVTTDPEQTEVEDLREFIEGSLV